MSFDLDLEAELENTSAVGLEEEDVERESRRKNDWFKGSEKRSWLVAITLFDRLEVTACKIAIRKARQAGEEKPSMDKLKEVAAEALKKRAATLNKSVDALTDYEKLDLNSPKFFHQKGFYIKDVGYVRPKDPNDSDPIWRRPDDEKKEYYTTLLLFYPCDVNARIQTSALKDGWEVKRWKATGKSYTNLNDQAEAERAKGRSAGQSDIKLKCVNPQFQGFEATIMGDATYRKSVNFQNLVLQRSIELYDKLDPFRPLSSEELRAKLGAAPNARESQDSSAAAAADVSVNDVLSSM